jgi:hypothetical protein
MIFIRIFKNRCKYHTSAGDVSELNAAIKIMNIFSEDFYKWSRGLKLNPTKTQALIIASPNTHSRIDIITLTQLKNNDAHISFQFNSTKYWHDT